MYKVWNNFKTVLLMASLMGLCLGVGYLFGGPSALLPALLIGGVMNLVAFFFSDKIALMTMRAVEVNPIQDSLLYGIVKNLSLKSGLPMPRVYVSPAAAPNAFATGRGPNHSAICVTAGLRKILNADELEGVIAHELSHVKHRDILIGTMVAVIAGVITRLSYLALFSSGDRNRRGNPLMAILLIVLAPIAAMLIQMAISRSREFEADRLGAELAGTGHGLAGALSKLDMASRHIPLHVPDAQCSMFIVEPFTGSSMRKLFMTHPPTEERIKRLMALRQ
jgi:heat shock protein HtpX